MRPLDRQLTIETTPARSSRGLTDVAATDGEHRWVFYACSFPRERLDDGPWLLDWVRGQLAALEASGNLAVACEHCPDRLPNDDGRVPATEEV